MHDEIILTQFERYVEEDQIYSIIGRSLTFATYFESQFRTFIKLFDLKIRLNADEILSSEENMNRFINDNIRKSLNNHIENFKKYIFPENQENYKQNEFDILHKARIARNKIAHELTIGLNGKFTERIQIKDIKEDTNKYVIDIAHAMIFIGFLTAILTKQQMPTITFLEDYPLKAAAWVCDSQGCGGHG